MDSRSMNGDVSGAAHTRGGMRRGASFWRRWGWRWGCFVALLAAIAVGWEWNHWVATRNARAWASARPTLSRERVFDEARRQTASFGASDWSYLVAAAINADEDVEAWLGRRRAQAPSWLQSWIPASLGQEPWIDLELAWKSCALRSDAMRISLIQRADGLNATHAWRLLDLALGESEPLSAAVVEAAARRADALDFRGRLILANGLTRATPEAQKTARRLLEGWSGDAHPTVSETARRLLEHPPYR